VVVDHAVLPDIFGDRGAPPPESLGDAATGALLRRDLAATGTKIKLKSSCAEP
jgi:hypothetical protein